MPGNQSASTAVTGDGGEPAALLEYWGGWQDARGTALVNRHRPCRWAPTVPDRTAASTPLAGGLPATLPPPTCHGGRSCAPHLLPR